MYDNTESDFQQSKDSQDEFPSYFEERELIGDLSVIEMEVSDESEQSPKKVNEENDSKSTYVTFVNSSNEYWGRIYYFEVGASNIKMKKLTEIWFEIKLNSNIAYIDLADSKATILDVIPTVDGCNTSQIDLDKNEFWHNDISRLPETIFSGELEKNKTYYIGETRYLDEV